MQEYKKNVTWGKYDGINEARNFLITYYDGNEVKFLDDADREIDSISRKYQVGELSWEEARIKRRKIADAVRLIINLAANNVN